MRYLAPILFFLLGLYLIETYGLNVAHWDDHALKMWILNFENEGIFPKIFAFHNEHIIALTRFGALGIYKVTGVLNYKTMMFLGWGMLFLSAIFVQKNILGRNLLSGLFVAICLLSTAYYENMLWGMASIQNFGVILFTILAFHKAAEKSWQWAVVFCMIALFTSGNALIGIIAILLFASFEGGKNRIWLIPLMILMIGVYIYSLNQTTIETRATVSIKDLIKNFILFSGNVFAKSRNISFLVGIFNIAVGIAAIISWYFSSRDRTENFLLLMVLFALGTIAATTLSRSSFGLETLLTSKYRIYPMLLTMCSFIWLRRLYKPSLHLGILATGSIMALNLKSDLKAMEYMKRERIAEFYESHVVQDRISSGLTFIVPPKELEYLAALKIDSSRALGKFEAVDQFQIKCTTDSHADFYVLRNTHKTYLFPTQIDAEVSRSYIDKRHLQAGNYRGFWLTKNLLSPTDDVVTVAAKPKPKTIKNW